MDMPAINAAITAPVSRHLVVADIAGSMAFYKTVLGFQTPAAPGQGNAPAYPELVYGPAHIMFHTQEGVIDSTGPLRPRGKAMLFFETDNVRAMYTALKERGAEPTEPERVNWIKMEMFEVRDPDGHRLWYGQSFHEPYLDMHTPPGRGQLRQIMPAFPFSDVPAAVSHYRDVLGFSVNYQQHDLGVMDRDEVRILLVARTADRTGSAGCCVYIQAADALYAELLAKGARVQGEPVSRPWGLRDFDVLDIEGNRITFAQTFE